MIITTIKDKKANVFFNPVVQNTEEEALRTWTMIKRDQEPIKTYPEDFEFWKLADYNKDTGEITPNKTKLEG